jgi:Dolichyl-phosphate-mannose-protein mannosyltransferase
VPSLIFRTLGELIAFACCAFAAGSLLVAGLRRLARGHADETPSMRGGALRLLAGFGGVAYAALVLALLHGLRWWVLAPLGSAVLLAARRDLRAYAHALRRPRGDPVALAAFALAGAMAAGQFLAALAPSEAYDELAYHLPIANAIGSSHAAHQLLHASGIYGNLPSLGECLYAAALAVDGVALAHALHLAVFLAFVALAAAIVREQCGPRWAALTAIALLAYPHLTYNATTAYVDGAATAFELGALVLALRWVARDQPADLFAASLLLGLALSVKYTSLFTAALVGLVVAVTAVRRRALRLPATAAGITLVTSAFWYVKNLIRFGNPVWPFYLGHRGVDDSTYTAFISGVHAFGPRTLHAFLEVPWRLSGDASLVPFLALSLVVLALVPRPSRALAGFALVFASYWFWLATHQVRFLLTGVAASIIAVVVALAAGGRALRVAFAVAAIAAIVVAQTRIHPFSIAGVPGALAAELGSPKAQYAVGLESRSAYLRRYFGCEADAVSFLAARPALSPVLMRQTALEPWFGGAVQFGKLPLGAVTPARAARALQAGGFKSALVRASEPGTFATGEGPSVAVDRRLRRIWHEGDCTIFRVA